MSPTLSCFYCGVYSYLLCYGRIIRIGSMLTVGIIFFAAASECMAIVKQIGFHINSNNTWHFLLS